MSNWLEASDWARVQRSVPIVCVDVLPYRANGDRGGAPKEVGLIFRETPHQSRRWCLVGGRLWRNESLAEGLARQLRETLGDGIRFEITPGMKPLYIAEYFTFERELGLLDPRQHAVGMTFAVPIEGPAVAQGEAISFSWFDPEQLPAADAFGFGQDRVVAALLEQLRSNSRVG